MWLLECWGQAKRTNVKSHFIFYKFSKKTKIIEIIRILHHQMDIENRIK